MEYLFDLSVAEEEIYRLDEGYDLPSEVLSCFQQIMTIAVEHYVHHTFTLPKEFSIRPIDEHYEKVIVSFINTCLAGASVIGVKYSNESTKITLS